MGDRQFVAVTTEAVTQAPPAGISRLWNRQLEAYPETGPRMLFLAITVLATVTLYYELYVAGSVSTLILQNLNMSFSFFVTTLAIGNLIGAFGSLFAGLTDRLGRTNLVVAGLLLTGILVVWVIPAQTGKWGFTAASFAVGLVEGICLVATPALIRDFSPQTGRATAMGFWTSGPVLGSLVVAVVASATIHGTPNPAFWSHEYRICGVVGLVVFVIALFGLKELSPGLRDQLMVSLKDRALVEARAKGINVDLALRKPWRQVLRADVVLSAVAISLLLIIYYTAVGFNVIYFETIFGFSPSQANGIGNWWWAADAIALIVIGIVSDLVRVRKPFMMLGAAGAVAFTIVYLGRATDPHTGYYTLVWIVSLLAIFLAFAFAPWMASFTETVERRSPALTAHGLAVWGWVVRATVAISVFVLPFVVSSTNALVQYGTIGKRAAAIEKADPTIKIVLAHPAIFSQLAKYPTTSKIPGPLLAKAIKEVGLKNLLAVAKDPHVHAEAAFFTRHASQLHQVVAASHSSPVQWQHWWWVCVAAELAFVPLVLFMTGRWSPRAAKRDQAEHDARVQEELAKLRAEGRIAPDPA